jgi:transcriptional regulator with XRE-family HTH domain
MDANDKESLQRLGKLMAQRRMELNMSKRATAEAAGISINTYQRVEDGSPVRDVTYAKIENALGWAAGSVHEILDGANEPVVISSSSGRGTVVARVPEDALRGAVTSAFVAVSDTLTAAEIRELSRRVVDDLKQRGIVDDI